MASGKAAASNGRELTVRLGGLLHSVSYWQLARYRLPRRNTLSRTREAAELLAEPVRPTRLALRSSAVGPVRYLRRKLL